MTTRQVITELIADYRHNIKLGMTQTQARQIFLEMVIEFIEGEKSRSFQIGEKSGRLGAMSDKLLGHVFFDDMADNTDADSQDRI